MRKAEKELKKQLKQDVEIPSVVRRKTDMAFTKIRNVAKEKKEKKQIEYLCRENGLQLWQRRLFWL